MPQIFSVKYDQLTLQEILEKVKNSIDRKAKLQIVTLNTEMVIAAREDKDLAKIINSSGLVIPESSGLELAKNFQKSKKGKKLTRLFSSTWETIFPSSVEGGDRLSGVDLSYALVGLCQEFGYKIVLLGGGPEIATTAAEQLKKQFPKLKVVGIESGSLEQNSTDIFNLVKQNPSDILLVAFGHGKQEKWIADNLQKIPTAVAVGVGGTLDFMAGKATRAPRWVRSMGMEWAFRLAVQPWRAKRQLALIRFINLLLKEK